MPVPNPLSVGHFDRLIRVVVYDADLMKQVMICETKIDTHLAYIRDPGLYMEKLGELIKNDVIKALIQSLGDDSKCQ